MALAARHARAVFFGITALMVGACTPRGAQLPPEAQAALRGLPVGPGSPSSELLRWRLAQGCRLEYAARLGGDPFRFSMTGSGFGYVYVDYPMRLVPAGGSSSLSLATGDNDRRFLVVDVSPAPVDEQGRPLGKGFGHGVLGSDEGPPPWTGVGSRPGLRVFFPPLPQYQNPKWETPGWTPTQLPRSVRTTFDGWFNIGGHPTALVRARSDDGRFQGSYLVLASGCLLWAGAVVDGQSGGVIEAKLVSACDGPTLTSPPAAVDEIVALAGGTVGFAALDLWSGRALGWHEREAFPTQSVFKLPIAIEVLRQIDDEKLALDRVVALGPADARSGPDGTIAVPAKKTIRELIEAMLINSDNVACDKLLALLGGPRAVDTRMRALGIDGITIRFTELDLGAGKGDNTATPAAMVALLEKIARSEVGLSPASAALLDDILLRVTTGVQRIKGALPPGTPVAHKTGTSGTQGGKTDATNDVGLITLPNGHRIAVAVFIHASPADLAIRERTIARLARVAYDAFSGRGP